jgi:hypothetical protein
MGLWSKIAGIGLAGAGLVTGNPALVGIGASVLSGGMAADASKDAAQTQSESADRAMAENRRVYDQSAGIQKQVYDTTRADLAPYMAVGGGAMGNAGSMVGLSPGAGGGTSIASMANGVTAPGQMIGAGQSVDPGPSKEVPQVKAAMANQSGYQQGEKRGGSRAVLLRSPDGEIRAFPEDQAEVYVSRGAQRLGGSNGLVR